MILAIDIGNTNIVIGCMEGEKIHFAERLQTNSNKTRMEYLIEFKGLLEFYNLRPADVEGAIIASVVPPVTGIIREAVRSLIGCEPVMYNVAMKTGMKVYMDQPANVGADLIVNAVAAVHYYGAPAIIIDMGTATTLSVVDKDGNYIGGQILPGVRTSLDALVNRTAQLPKIALEAPDKLIATNTINCMKSGIIIGQAACMDGMVDRILEELGYPAVTIATGGLSKVIMPFAKNDIIVDDDLTLKGLRVLYDMNTGDASKEA